MTGIAYGKILGENELGSMTLPGKPVRGTFILIGTKYRHLFPPMSKTIHNDIQLVKILYNDEENAIWCKYDWHNSKFSKPGVGKAWDETRLYLNSLIHPDNLRFEPDDIVIWRSNSESDIIHLSHFKQHEPIYQKIVEYSQKLRGNHFFVDENILPPISWHQSDSISSIIPEDGQVTEVTKSWMEGGNSEKQLTSELFRQFVRRAYGNRCGITGNVIRVGDLMNIEAAHIWPDSHQGPMMPDNGVAMDRNLHWAFDKGMFTLKNKGEKCYVEIHPDCMDIEMLREIADSELRLPEGTYACFKPNPRYIEYHRNNIFGLFKTSGSIRQA